MELYLDSFFANPFIFFQAAFALMAGVAFVIFLSGLLSGVKNLVTLSENVEHVTHARTRAVWGAGWLLILFIVWEILRWLGGFF